jgi:tetratricopeptide (TPR) repeat protein
MTLSSAARCALVSLLLTATIVAAPKPKKATPVPKATPAAGTPAPKATPPPKATPVPKAAPAGPAKPVADSPWAIPDAPFRAIVRAKAPPNGPEAGWLIDLPEFGQTNAGLGDCVLLDQRGNYLPVYRQWRGEGQHALLLAQQLTVGEDYFVYFGGKMGRKNVGWFPKVSLLMETRRAPADADLSDWPVFEKQWKRANDPDGAGFVPIIGHRDNPFGDGANFFTHYSGWLITNGKPMTLYTMSSDASFVVVSDKYEFGWPGKHSGRVTLTDVRKKEVPTSTGLTKIDYYHAKLGDNQPPAMLLGVVNGATLNYIPATGWLHPGTTDLMKLEHAKGWPVPVVDATYVSYLGWAGAWLYETKMTIRGGLPAGWTAAWDFTNGQKMEGAGDTRLLLGSNPVRANVVLRHGAEEVRGVKRFDFPSIPPPPASTGRTADLNRYLAMIEKEDAAAMSADALRAVFNFVYEFGTDQQVSLFSKSWLAKNPDSADPAWIQAQQARLTVMAQTDPKQAVAELHKLDFAARKRWAKELGLLELDLLVFYLKDDAAIKVAQQVSFQFTKTDADLIAKIRIGDLYRLTGRIKEAADQYRAAQKTIVDESNGRKFAAQDRSFSIAIIDLLENEDRKEALAKLGGWETEHPLAKLDSDFLLLRGRALMLFGRWNEALQEIENFATLNPDSPYQILAEFHRARALWGLGRKDEAKKIWAELAAKYPKHELAPESLKLSKQT